MRLDYKNNKLKKICLNDREADRALGSASGKKLRTRLSEIDAALHVEELVAGRPHPLSGDCAGEFALDLGGGMRLVFVPQEEPIPLKADGGIDWSDVKDIKVVFIGDYHD